MELAQFAQTRKRTTGQWRAYQGGQGREGQRAEKNLRMRAPRRRSPTIFRHSDFHENPPDSPSQALRQRNFVSTTIRLPEFCLPPLSLPWLSFRIGRSFCLVCEPLISFLLPLRLLCRLVDFLGPWEVDSNAFAVTNSPISGAPYFSDPKHQRQTCTLGQMSVAAESGESLGRSKGLCSVHERP